MEKHVFFDPNLSKQDRLVLENLAADVRLHAKERGVPRSNGHGNGNGKANSGDPDQSGK